MEKPITELTVPGKRHSSWCDDDVAYEVLAGRASLLSIKLLETTLVSAFQPTHRREMCSKSEYSHVQHLTFM